MTRKEGFAEQLVVDMPEAMATCVGDSQSLQLVEEKQPKDQRMTRAAYRRREKEQRDAVPVVYSPTSEPVGGARSKRSVVTDLHGMLQKLKKKDG